MNGTKVSSLASFHGIPTKRVGGVNIYRGFFSLWAGEHHSFINLFHVPTLVTAIRMAFITFAEQKKIITLHEEYNLCPWNAIIAPLRF